MQKILVLGGTRFFEKKLVEQLIREEDDVTIVTRGQASDPFGDTVKRLKADRSYGSSRSGQCIGLFDV
jgi:nucleoside-diphosphate-sugar epimerase